MSIRKIGGLTFIAIGRVRIQFCIAKPAPSVTARRFAFALSTIR